VPPRRINQPTPANANLFNQVPNARLFAQHEEATSNQTHSSVEFEDVGFTDSI